VLTNFRPGLAEELGLDWAGLAEQHPRLIVGNVSAFGRQGPDAGLAGMDMVIQARSGLMATLGRVQDGVPTAGDAPVADYVCALTLAVRGSPPPCSVASARAGAARWTWRC
jgi:crotonobetainyl-CoA:carnitine CoA-transferase CaiB-like acyl-CoA transferase